MDEILYNDSVKGELIPESAPVDGQESFVWSRRSFLQWLGVGALGVASGAASGLSSCRGEPRFIAPYKNSPEWSVPGVATYYASAWASPWGGIPLLVTSYQGRPTMIAGVESVESGEYFMGKGCPAWATAGLWDLYSPERSQHVLYYGKEVKETAASNEMGLADMAAAFRSWNKGISSESRVAIVLGTESSPTRSYLCQKLQEKNPQVQFFQYDPIGSRDRENSSLEAYFGEPLKAEVDFTQVNLLLSIGADFLGTQPRDGAGVFCARRGLTKEGRVAQEVPELYCVEEGCSLTGGMADMRLMMNPVEQEFFLYFLAVEILPAEQGLGEGLEEESHDDLSTLKKWAQKCAQALIATEGKCLILLGEAHAQKWHDVVLLLNQVLGVNRGEYPILRWQKQEELHYGSIEELHQLLMRGEIDILCWLSPANPLTTRPSVEQWECLVQERGVQSIYLAPYVDDFACVCTWHIPQSHFLESWGDVYGGRGHVYFTQPVIMPLVLQSCSVYEFLLGLLSPAATLRTTENSVHHISPAYYAIKSCAERLARQEELPFSWEECLQTGRMNLAWERGLSPSRVLTEKFIARLKSLWCVVPERKIGVAEKNQNVLEEESLMLSFVIDSRVGDGRYINNAWLEEMPDPVTQVVWGNVAQISEKTREKCLCLNGAISDNAAFNALQITTKAGSITIPFICVPSIAEGVIILPLGYGQKCTGLVGHDCGVDVNVLRSEAERVLSSGVDVILVQIAEELIPPRAQEEASLSQEMRKEMISGKNSVSIPVATGEDVVHQWGMVIDLSKCTGCQACVVACMAENNIPLVGRQEAARARLMHWLHVDRYFLKKESGLAFQPRACQQCEKAPCEVVCPMAATAHTPDGLNAMAYSRCVGTRYCANNCPYKVRRFNYFDYNKYNPYKAGNWEKGAQGLSQVGAPPHIQRNPRVTVRSRGVMEKCTYCVQRLESAKNAQKRALRLAAERRGVPSSDIELQEGDMRIPPDSVRCACQEACPTGAISFGNLADKEKAQVYRWRHSGYAYALLGEMELHPRTVYLPRGRV